MEFSKTDLWLSFLFGKERCFVVVVVVVAGAGYFVVLYVVVGVVVLFVAVAKSLHLNVKTNYHQNL